MTADHADGQDDDVLAALASLRSHDVSLRQRHRLRQRCHALLQTPPPPAASAAMENGTAFRRIIGPALGGAWCLAYLVEIVRRAAAVYYGTQ
jgi:hypothetical protein